MPNDPQRTKWLARTSENFFDKACIDARLTASPPKHDENGWDFFVEMPPNRIPNIFLDAQPSPIKFLCQVKATDDFSSLRLSMKVSNFENLARTILPAFVVVIDYRGLDEPQYVYVCHFGNERISQTLKRMRELQAKNQTQLNQHEMALSAKFSEKADFHKQEWLFNEILKHTNIDLSAYTRQKIELLDTLGYNEGRYRRNYPGPCAGRVSLIPS
ncbi:hypothetical protein ACFQ12_05580 [Methylobacterium trifolii]